MTATLIEFLESKGGVGLLVVLQERGKTYSEIEPDVLITSSTISTRLDDALEIGLIEMKPARRGDRTMTEYHLTDFGEEVVHELAVRGVVSNYRDMRTHHRAVERKTSEFIEWVHDNPGRLAGFREVHDETLIIRGAEETESGDGEDGDDENTESTERVVRPHTEDLPDDVPVGSGEGDSEASSETEGDDAQKQLSDPDVQEKMQEAARNTNTDDEEE